MPLTPASTASQLATERLGQPVTEWIDERREAGKSWRLIARELLDTTGVDVAGETLRLWSTSTEAAAS